jgi:DNA primase
VNRIADPAVRALYSSAMRDRLAEAWGGSRRAPGQAQGGTQPGRTAAAAAADAYRIPAGRSGDHRTFPRDRAPWSRGGAGGGGWRGGEPPRPIASHSLRRSGIVGGDAGRPPYREALLLRALINHPWLIEAEAERIATIELTSGALSRLRDALITLLSGDISLDRSQIRSQLTGLGLDKVVDLVERAITHKSDRFAEPDTAEVEVERGWRHTLALHEQQTGLRKALAAAEEAFRVEGTEDALSRIVEIKHRLSNSEELQLPDER